MPAELTDNRQRFAFGEALEASWELTAGDINTQFVVVAAFVIHRTSGAGTVQIKVQNRNELSRSAERQKVGGSANRIPDVLSSSSVFTFFSVHFQTDNWTISRRAV
jgi:hypothetical protein